MPFLANDRLDPARSHGDVLLSISADSPDVVHLRAAPADARGPAASSSLRWMIDGFNRAGRAPTPGTAPVRNLMGFKDGTANLDPATTR